MKILDLWKIRAKNSWGKSPVYLLIYSAAQWKLGGFFIVIWLSSVTVISLCIRLLLLWVKVVPIWVVLANNSFYLHACETL